MNAPTSLSRVAGPAIAPRVALLGTGKMGSAIAVRLAGAGFKLTVWNRTRSRAMALGVGEVSDSPAAAVSAADVVISSLTGPDAIRAAYLGRDGALAGSRDRLFIEMSTAGPEVVAELASAARWAGSRLVDAPILGSPAIVGTGEAAILVGGEPNDVDRAAAVLSVVGNVRRVGSLGSGARLKLIANSMLGDIVLAAAELQVAGEAAGLDPRDVFWALQRLAPSLEARRAGYLDDRHVPVLFAVRDLAKDLGLAMALFDQSASRAPMTGLAAQLMSADAAETPGLEITAVIEPYRVRSRSRGAVLPKAPTPARSHAA